MTVAVFGHQNPDTDAITSALVYTSFLSKTGVPATAYRLGDLNSETKFVLERARVAAPELTTALPAGTEVALTDHNEALQSIANLGELKLTRVIDHHKISLSSSEPLYLRFEPLGCTGTILAKLYVENNVHIEVWEADLMLSAILSDTLHFRSPTTTPIDREMGTYLGQIAGVNDLEKYALEQFAAKSDLGDMSAAQMLKTDYKLFSFAGKVYGLGVLESTDLSYALGRKAELLQAMQDEKDEQNLAGIFLSLIDILEEKNLTLVLGPDEQQVLEGAFKATVKDDLADLGPLISRKKQIVPVLEGYLG